MQHSNRLIIIFLAIFAVAAFGTHAMAQAVHKQLQEKQQEADRTEQLMKRLKAREGGLSQKLRDIRSRMKTLLPEVRAQEAELHKIREHEHEARKEHYELDAKRKQLLSELQNLVKSIWPVHLTNLRAQLGNIASWDSADRRFTWLAEVYGATREKFVAVRETTEKLAKNLERQKLLEKEAEAQLKRVNASKDRLLRDKLALRRELRNVREKKQDLESQLKGILADIKTLNYRLQTQKTKNFKHYKRALPWPAAGSVAAGFSPSATPPRRGLAIETGDQEEVRSVFWGKVVHNDLLRGFGQVVIVYHGFDYYSLYAFMSETFVQTGQEVEKDEPIGKTGYYPLVGGPGLYFELRFHQKPINPKHWLTSR
ncbi:murein hydrolase activator EnvC family protein [Desulfovibrio oxyclinae]|uniref:murein hydrolase activator EnvC family protein n=1 Tax=Desulfovibrio oxyclinae TaxID=63560 RepID=UPI0003803665|nr:peptidoglycan DD-metalloendopeptidase family protein [Desulfovibrio oxyclinae]